MMNSAPLFKIKQISYQDYGPIDLSLEANECIAIQGPSGTGKSLFLKVLADLIPHQGEKYFLGKATSCYTPSQWRKNIGLLLANSQWWAADMQQHFQRLSLQQLASLGLDPDLLQKPPSLLSSGQLQRFSLLRLLENEPKVLLLDEPTAHLDETSLQRVEALIAQYQQRTAAAIIWVSHNQQQVIRMASRVYHFEQGKLLLNAEEASRGGC